MSRSYSPQRWILHILLLLNVPLFCYGQESDVTFVTSDGVGSVYMPPSHVSFWLHYPLPEGDLSEGFPAARALDVALREYLAAQELRPTSTDVYPPSLIALEGSLAETSVEVRFSMAGLVGGELGAIKFGGLCEAMKTLGAALGCRVSNPNLLLAEKNVPIQDAVAEATKQAFVSASGAAAALGATIRSVAEVKIGEVVWNNPPETEATFPNIETIACTASVQVTYELQY